MDTIHQIHHSPQRLEVITSFYEHPLKMTVNSIIGSLLVCSFLGLNMEAGAIYTLYTALGKFFYHTNIKAPQWVGYVFKDLKRIAQIKNTKCTNNYGDIVWWDMLFGTYQKPKGINSSCCFDSEKRIKTKRQVKV